MGVSSPLLIIAVSAALTYLQCIAAQTYCPQDIHLSPAPNSYYGYNLDYGQSIQITCTSTDASRLRLTRNTEKVVTEEVNATTIRWFLNKPGLQAFYFLCIDIDTKCTNSMSISVVPAVKITTPHIRKDHEMIIIRYGDPFELFCSGPETGSLVVTTGNAEELPEELPSSRINKTTIKFVISKPEIQDSRYVCVSTKLFKYWIHVVVDSPPETVSFECISYNLELLNCSWTALSERTNFTLYFNDEESTRTIKICTKVPAKRGTRFCTWSRNDYPSYPNDVGVLVFVMQTCNDFGCANQTIDIDHHAILKPSPPENLQVTSKSSRSVSLEWDINAMFVIPHSSPEIDHKIQYWLSGSPIRDVDTEIYCHAFCQADIELPCPAKYYQIWVFVKPTAAIGDQFWSVPASISFYTDADKEKVPVDPICEWEPKKTKEVMAYLINNLKKEVRKAMMKRKKELVLLEEKHATYRLMEDNSINIDN